MSLLDIIRNRNHSSSLLDRRFAAYRLIKQLFGMYEPSLSEVIELVSFVNSNEVSLEELRAIAKLIRTKTFCFSQLQVVKQVQSVFVERMEKMHVYQSKILPRHIEMI